MKPICIECGHSSGHHHQHCPELPEIQEDEPAMNTKLKIALDALIKKYGAATQLFVLPQAEFDSTDTLIGAVLYEAGYDERSRNIINAFTWWGISIEEFAEILQSDLAYQSSP